MVLCLFAVYFNLTALRHVAKDDVGMCLATSVLCQLTTKVLVQSCIVVMWLGTWFMIVDQEFKSGAKYCYAAYCGICTLALFFAKPLMLKYEMTSALRTLKKDGSKLEEGEVIRWEAPEVHSSCLLQC